MLSEKTKIKTVDKFGESELKLHDIVDYIMRLVAVQISTIQIPDIDAYQKYEIDDKLLDKVNSGDLSDYAKNEILKSIVSEIEGKLSAIGGEVAGSQKVTGAINNRVTALAAALHTAIEQNQKEHEDIKKRIPSIKGLAAKSDLDTQILKIKNAILDQVRRMIDEMPSGSTTVIRSGASGSGTPGGSSGDIQYNNAGAFGGFTVNGDATVDTSTGKLTLTSTTVTAGSYGTGTQVPQIVIGSDGRITSAMNQLISFPSTPTLQQVTTAGATSNVAVSFTNLIDVDNVRINGNTISTTNTNGDLLLDPNGTGGVDIPLSTTAGRFYLNGVGQIAVNGGTPGTDIFYMTNTDTGITRAVMVFAASASSNFAGFEARDITTTNNWKMGFQNSTISQAWRLPYNDTNKVLVSTTGQMRLTNGSTTAPQARLHIEEDTAAAEMLRLDSAVGTGIRNIDRTYMGDVQTTDATATTIATVAASTASRGYTITAILKGRVTSGAAAGEIAVLRKEASFKNIAGTVTQVGATTVITSHLDTSLGATDLTFNISGTDVQLQATGIASNTINWRTTYTWSLF